MKTPTPTPPSQNKNTAVMEYGGKRDLAFSPNSAHCVALGCQATPSVTLPTHLPLLIQFSCSSHIRAGLAKFSC